MSPLEFVTEPSPPPTSQKAEWDQGWKGSHPHPLTPPMGSACAAEKVSDFPPNSPEWLALRAGKLGGSDAGTLIGAGFKDWWELIVDKAVIQEAKPPTDAMNRGNWLEPAALAFAADKGYVANSEMHGTWMNPEFPYANLNPDGIDTDKGVLIECKTARMRFPEKWGRAGTDKVPLGYLAQVTFLCGILGYEKWVIPVIATKGRVDRRTGEVESDFDFALYRGKFNPELFAELIDRAEDFMADLAEFRRGTVT